MDFSLASILLIIAFSTAQILVDSGSVNGPADSIQTKLRTTSGKIAQLHTRYDASQRVDLQIEK